MFGALAGGAVVEKYLWLKGGTLRPVRTGIIGGPTTTPALRESDGALVEVPEPCI